MLPHPSQPAVGPNLSMSAFSTYILLGGGGIGATCTIGGGPASAGLTMALGAGAALGLTPQGKPLSSPQPSALQRSAGGKAR